MLGLWLEISGILLTMDFDVILGMDWLAAHQVVIDCDCRRITANTQDGIYVIFQAPRPCTTLGSLGS